MRDVPLPAYTVSADSANLVLHRFCHSTIFVGPMVRSQDIRKHVLKARGILLSTPITNHLSIRSNHTTRDANQDHGAVGTGNDATWNREDCGLWSCDGGSVGTQVQGCQGREDSRQHRCARRTSSRSPNKAHQGDWKSNREIH